MKNLKLHGNFCNIRHKKVTLLFLLCLLYWVSSKFCCYVTVFVSLGTKNFPFLSILRQLNFFWGMWQFLIKIMRESVSEHSWTSKAGMSQAGGQGTVCWIGVKVAVLCAQQYMSWNIFLIKILNNFWYFEHPILTMIYSEAYLKHNWRNCLWKKKKSTILKTISSIMLQICFWASPSKDSVFEISKMIQNFD